MKNKILLLLLIIPFAIVFIVFLSTDVLIVNVNTDIEGISWKYLENEGILIGERLDLEAEGIFPNGYIENEGNDLVWVSEDTNIASIHKEDDKYYLIGESEGETKITCSNEKGNVSRYFNLIVSSGPTIIINDAKYSNSGNSISGINYYGEYDFDNNFNKIPANTSLNISFIGLDENRYSYRIIGNEEEVLISDNNEITFLDGGEIKVSVLINGTEISKDYTFNVIKDGVNVYDFYDLMHCTNLSSDGEIVVLKTNLVSNSFLTNPNNQNIINQNKDIYQVFGDNSLTKVNKDGQERLNFDDFLYKFTSTFSTDYIDAFNEEYKNDSNVKKLTKEVLVGVHIQKDFYGNGFNINLNNLVFPSSIPTSIEGSNIYLPSDVDYFKGPLIYYAIKSNGGESIVEVYGQDNIGFYIDGNNITIDDVIFSNVEQQNVLNNYIYAGTVVELNGDNITLKNSIFENGRNVVRDFATLNKETMDSTNENILIDNCLLRNSREFLLKVGSNSFEKLSDLEYSALSASLKNNMNNILDTAFKYLSGYHYTGSELTKDEINDLLNDCLRVSQIYDGDSDKSLNTNPSLYSGSSKIKDEEGNLIYTGSTTVKDTYFSKAGLFSISLDSMFDGSVLYGKQPNSLIEVINNTLKSITPNVGGTSYPTILKLSGDTRFYDWKDISNVDSSSLIGGTGYNENNVRDYFPLESIIKDYINENPSLAHTRSDGRTFVNGAITYYGGGFNFSKLDISELVNKDLFNLVNDEPTDIEANLFTYFALNPSEVATIRLIQGCIPFASGFNSFRFNLYHNASSIGAKSSDLYSETSRDGNIVININDLKNRA